MSNETLKVLLQHRSIRKFKPDTLDKATVEQIVAAGQMASSSSHVQAFSVIAVTDQERKKTLAELTGNQSYVADCPVFLVWCADLSRLKYAADHHLPGQDSYEGATESFIIGTVDTALAAQNAAIAAESMGLGIVYIGGIRNRIAEVSQLLELPNLVYPVFGMCVGYPDQEPGQRPRLPVDAVLHWEAYDEHKTPEQIAAYDTTMVEYIKERTHGERDKGWSALMADKLTVPSRLHMKKYLEDRGFKMD
ncbi:FMN reductase (NADPH) [Paenibacillus shirakamiensis]|uniref:FMN reductase (NADPH) n=1 Tax=Paenibacillus shirakamiensis TaxID=1265935 RepID=A0ABS4JIR8_9BACL|nr:oxygen-insensitive NADPH nitroreductase [Paenibacillus shirakamiensis]MBP2001591.1 FMN reductase (NADPH) [Paenibacillus shirakamiensis]